MTWNTTAPTRCIAPALELGLTEAAFQRQVEQLLDLCGWWYHHNSDSRRASAGLLDLVAIHPGMRRLVFAELKTERGKLRFGRHPGDVAGRRVVQRFEPGQGEWIEALRTIKGVEVFLWRPSDWGRIVEILNDGRIITALGESGGGEG